MEMTTTKRETRLIRSGAYIAEVPVELLCPGTGWSPYLSVEDAEKLDDVREALEQGDIKRASEVAQVYSLTPVAGK